MNAISPDFLKELPIPLVATVKTDHQDSRTVDGEKRANTVEFLGEDPQNDQRKGELRESGAHVGSFEGSLRCPYFDYLVLGQFDCAGTVHA